MLKLERQGPGSAGAFILFLSSGGRAARIYCEYNAPLYNQGKTQEFSHYRPPRLVELDKGERGMILFPFACRWQANGINQGLPKNKNKKPKAKPTIYKKQPADNTILAT